uniref:Retinoblastoma-like protein n=1 Tax=Tetraselmis sp. GSL018 TaxID=582737 RepID=A0A061S5N6_9CHLO
MDRLGLKAFDMFKIIQTFVSHEPTLPKELLYHLANVEERIVESLAWLPGSTLFPALIAAKYHVDNTKPLPSKSPKRKCLFCLRSERHDISSFEMVGNNHMSFPMGLKRLKTCIITKNNSDQHHKRSFYTLPPKQPASSYFYHAHNSAFQVVDSLVPVRPEWKKIPSLSPMAPGSILPESIGRDIEVKSHMDMPVIALLRDFFRKTATIANNRLAQLCLVINFQPYDHMDVLQKVDKVMRFVIFERTSLLYGRHLNQLLVCSLYGVCKILGLGHLTFKKLTAHFQKLAVCDNCASIRSCQNIFHNIKIQFVNYTMHSVEVGDVITFYNKVFIPAMKDYLKKIADTQSQVSADSIQDS